MPATVSVPRIIQEAIPGKPQCRVWQKFTLTVSSIGIGAGANWEFVRQYCPTKRTVIYLRDEQRPHHY
jgi:hypothetical protein